MAKSKKKSNVILIIIIIACIAVASYSIFMLVKSSLEYKHVDDVNNQVMNTIVKTEEDEPESFTFDFEAAKQINPDTLGLLYMPSLDSKLPIVSGRDNYYYLHHAFDGSESIGGTVFEEAGIKAEDIVTWDDFIEAGKVLKEKTGVNMLCMAESRNDTTYRLLMMEGGSFYFDKDGNTQVDSEASIQAMETCKKMYDAGITFNNSSWDDMVAGMGADKFACIADAVWMVGSIKEAAPDQSGKWAVMELPRFQADKEAQGASNGGSVLAVPSDSKSTEASKAFVKFVMENVDANVEGFQNYGLYPSYLKALESDVFKEGDEFFGGQQIFDLFTEVGKTVPQVNYTSNFAEALEMSKNSMANILLNDEDPTEVLKAEQEEMKAKFGK